MAKKTKKILSRPIASARAVAPGRLENTYGIEVLPGERDWGRYSGYKEYCKGDTLKVHSLNMTGESREADYSGGIDSEEPPRGRSGNPGEYLIHADSTGE